MIGGTKPGYGVVPFRDGQSGGKGMTNAVNTTLNRGQFIFCLGLRAGVRWLRAGPEPHVILAALVDPTVMPNHSAARYLFCMYSYSNR